MDNDLSAMLSGILNSPEEMEKLKSVANNLFGGENNSQGFEPQQKRTESPSPFGDINPAEIAGIMKMVGALKSNANDSRVGLLTALRPHLSEKRQKRTDDAIKILRLISLLPLVKELNIFNL